MFGIFASTPQAPERVPTDHITTVGCFDDTIIFKTFVMYTAFVFPEALDAKKLRSSLESVVSRPGWNKLGARLRINGRGELEHHIPERFSEARPAIGYDHVDHSNWIIEDHPTGSKIPRPPSDGRPAVVGNPNDLHDLIHGPNIPTKLDDYLYTDRPQLGLRVVSFKNSTVIVLHWIHLAFDAFAKRSLLEAWMLSLRGKGDDILEPLAPDNYVLDDLGKNPTVPHVLADRRVALLGLVSWVFQNAYRLAICKKEHRMVCVPAEFLAKLRKKALAELCSQAVGTEETPFLSEGDVLVAWFTRLALSNLSEDSETLVAVQQAYQWRPVLGDLVPHNRPFLCNCVGFLVTLMPAKDIFKKPLGYLASQIRRSIKEQGSREQVEAYSALVRQDTKNKAPPFFGDSSMQLMMFSNWQKAKMFEFDLSAAAIQPRDTPLFPSYAQNVQGPYNFTDGIIIVGKDSHGNYWLSGHKVKGEWELIKSKMSVENI